MSKGAIAGSRGYRSRSSHGERLVPSTHARLLDCIGKRPVTRADKQLVMCAEVDNAAPACMIIQRTGSRACLVTSIPMSAEDACSA